MERLDIFIKHDHRRRAENVNYRTRRTLNINSCHVETEDNFVARKLSNFNFAQLYNSRCSKVEVLLN